jgi:hypothetical protein
MARLQAKLSVPQSKEYVDAILAEKIGEDRYLLCGQELTGEELQLAAEAEYEQAHELDDLGATEPVEGEEKVAAAKAILAQRGVHSPDYNQLADALAEVTR